MYACVGIVNGYADLTILSVCTRGEHSVRPSPAVDFVYKFAIATTTMTTSRCTKFSVNQNNRIYIPYKHICVGIVCTDNSSYEYDFATTETTKNTAEKYKIRTKDDEAETEGEKKNQFEEQKWSNKMTIVSHL